MSSHFTNFFSKLFGKIANKEFPKPIQTLINKLYIKSLGVDMSRFDDASSYKSLKELFTRPLKEMPQIDSDPKKVISPCDGQIIAFGKIKNNLALQIKGKSYNVLELLDEIEELDFLEGGRYINFYLSPKDYHRYHMPFDV
ncbi:MAG: hypothetical protein GXO02_06190 [Epsilonproteobacteria bacterium]|nr:hypothetical protein [Campylobacterota bacterium]